MDCRCLREVRLNEGLEQLGGEGDGAFQDSVIETVYIPSTLQWMQLNTFAGYKGLRRIRVG